MSESKINNKRSSISSIQKLDETNPISSDAPASLSPKQKSLDSNKIILQKTKQIRNFLLKRQEFHRKAFTIKESLPLKELFEIYTVWKDFENEFNNKQIRDSFKLVNEQKKIYFGQVKNHRKNGKGISLYEDGRIYEGYYLENQKHGSGVQSYPNGNIYIGNFEHNKKHGKGQMYWFSLHGKEVDQYYIGQWWGGLPFGSGKHQRSNGDFYQGTFKNGLKHGKGEQFFANGSRYKGQYINGVPEGLGQYTWSNGDVYLGQFKQGTRSGFGKWKNHDASQSYQGQYLFDAKCGQGMFSSLNGKIYKGSFVNDTFHGTGQLKEGNQIIFQGQWDNGKPIIQNNINTSLQLPKSVQNFQSEQISRYHVLQTSQNPERSSEVKGKKQLKKIIRQKSEVDTSRLIDRSRISRSNSKILDSSILNPYGYKSRNYGSINRRVGTQGNIILTSRQLGELKRPLSLAKISMKSNRGSLKKLQQMQTHCESHMMGTCNRKFGHKDCIPMFPWQKRGQRILQKLKSKQVK